ncbi:winged helix-turn-helix transcriptional regulator [Stutzerimonas zhaodongensis]|uniref:winged helix-turn-helix transcriptional regulator n=1 Tax=Stutzerimonas zhaodongensis TaxID=1176257 RepID=UPI0034E2E7AA
MTQDHSQNAPFDQPCPIRDVLDRIGDQWSFLVLEALAERTLRFNELSREIGDISARNWPSPAECARHWSSTSPGCFASDW